jgi:hypothetical protein
LLKELSYTGFVVILLTDCGKYCTVLAMEGGDQHMAAKNGTSGWRSGRGHMKKKPVSLSPKLMREQHNLCIELAVLNERVFRARLYKTGHLLNEAVKAIGYEVAAQRKEGRDE